jgi:hypothetical protein
VRAFLLVVATLGVAACDDPTVRAGGQRLAGADGVRDAPEAPLVELPAGDAPDPALPQGAKVVRLAADMDASWGRVRGFVAAARARGVRVILLVGKNRKVRALPPTVAGVPESILVEVNASHKTCIAPPGAVERMCVQRADGRHVDRANVRALVRDAVKEYGLKHVHVNVDPSVAWADAVRAIDGARTCCKDAVDVSVEGILLE